MTRAELERNVVEAERLAERWKARLVDAQRWEAYWLREANSYRAAIRRLEQGRAAS